MKIFPGALELHLAARCLAPVRAGHRRPEQAGLAFVRDLPRLLQGEGVDTPSRARPHPLEAERPRHGCLERALAARRQLQRMGRGHGSRVRNRPDRPIRNSERVGFPVGLRRLPRRPARQRIPLEPAPRREKVASRLRTTVGLTIPLAAAATDLAGNCRRRRRVVSHAGSSRQAASGKQPGGQRRTVRAGRFGSWEALNFVEVQAARCSSPTRSLPGVGRRSNRLAMDLERQSPPHTERAPHVHHPAPPPHEHPLCPGAARPQRGDGRRMKRLGLASVFAGALLAAAAPPAHADQRPRPTDGPALRRRRLPRPERVPDLQRLRDGGAGVRITAGGRSLRRSRS